MTDINGKKIKTGDIIEFVPHKDSVWFNHIVVIKINNDNSYQKAFITDGFEHPFFQSTKEYDFDILKHYKIIGHINDLRDVVNYKKRNNKGLLKTQHNLKICLEPTTTITDFIIEKVIFPLIWIFYWLFIAVGFYVVGEKVLNLIGDTLCH